MLPESPITAGQCIYQFINQYSFPNILLFYFISFSKLYFSRLNEDPRMGSSFPKQIERHISIKGFSKNNVSFLAPHKNWIPVHVKWPEIERREEITSSRIFFNFFCDHSFKSAFSRVRRSQEYISHRVLH